MAAAALEHNNVARTFLSDPRHPTFMPLLSVVIGVYNAAPYLHESLKSVLAQTDVDLELVAIDDGSNDGTPEILADVSSRDKRIRIVRQQNHGLTRALIRGCQLARGEYIARQDADDYSLPGRFRCQLQLLQARAEATLVAGWVHAIGPHGEPLVDEKWESDPVQATAELHLRRRGIVHGTAMFRKRDYERVGGYRAEFRVAQDVDLWLRLTDHGLLAVVPEYVYAWRVQGQSIGAARGTQQRALASIAYHAKRLRAAGMSEAKALEQAKTVSASPALPSRTAAACNDYFIGKLLFNRRDRRSIPYLWHCVRRMPWHGRAWAALLAAPFVTRPAQPMA